MISIEEAIRLRLTRYSTGQPCGRGHVAERRVKGRQCVECHNENARRSRASARSAVSVPRDDKVQSASAPVDLLDWPSLQEIGVIFTISSYEEAIVNGQKRFFTGLPCRHGHFDQRMVSTGGCVACAARVSYGSDRARERVLRRMIDDATRPQVFPQLPYISREEAIAKGQSVYFLGRICSSGHIGYRYVSNHECALCSRVRNTNRYATDPNHRARRIAYETKRNRRPEVRAKRLIKSAEYNRRPEVRKRYLSRLKTNLLVKLKTNISTYLRNLLRVRGSKKSDRLANILGCSLEYFFSHLSRQFRKGMSWDNYGKWEMDHIVALSTAKSETEIVKLFHHTNIRPIWKSQNRSKGSKREFLI